jgi:hypothetical protein
VMQVSQPEEQRVSDDQDDEKEQQDADERGHGRTLARNIASKRSYSPARPRP